LPSDSRMEIKAFLYAGAVEEAVSIAQEIYLGITVDRSNQKPTLIASSEGGMNIEEIASRSPEKIAKCLIDPLLGLKDYQLRDIAVSIDLKRNYIKPFMEIARALWRVFADCDASLTEANPLVEPQTIIFTSTQDIPDDNALFAS